LRFEFDASIKPDIATGKGSGGKGQLYIDDKLVGQTDIPYTLPLTMGLSAGASVGSDPGSPAIPDYQPPFEFTGKIYTATVDVSGDLIKDDEAAMKMMMARQ
ncbi:MAG: arylsulfatase, partial [Ignavibacteria bacterium]|nr:arylsulfatase [Ignavibacteria bacterium]